LQIWDIKTGEKLQTLTMESWGGFLVDGQFLTTSAIPGKVFYRTPGKEGVNREIALPSPINDVQTNFDSEFQTPQTALSPNGLLAASLFNDGTIVVWETSSGRILHDLQGFQTKSWGGFFGALAFSPDSSTLAVGSFYGEVAVWDVTAGPKT
ncbi:hypothetical protein EON80_32505, partial [bacterium]